MAKMVRFTPKKTPDGWRLNIPPKLSESGKRERHFFRTQALALAAAMKLKESREEFGNQTRAISPTLAEQATAAAILLTPFKLTVLEAAEIVVKIRERESRSQSMNKAADAWLLACEGLRPRTVQGYTQTAKRLKAALGDRILTSLACDEIQAALVPRGTPPTTAAAQIRNGKAFWNWCAEKGWCIADTFKRVKPPKGITEAGEIEILTPAEAECLLRTAENHFPAAVASYALQLFAGIRVEEMTRLEAGHVTADGIELPAAVTKKGRRRHITPNATLAAWLKKHPFEPCPNWRRVDRAVRYHAGWNIAPDPELVKLPEGHVDKVERRDWPQNAIRHSHASYAVATGTDLDTLLFEFGHTTSPSVLRAHYVGKATKKQAVEYFAIAPKGVTLKKRMEVVA